MAARNGVSLNWGGLDRALETAGRGLESRRLALMELVGDTLLSGTHERFDAEEDPEGKKWEPSARAREEGGKTLDDSSALRDSLDYLALPDRVMVGSNLPYARIHQKGGKTSPHVIRPKRKKARLSEESCGRRSIIRDRTFRPVRTLAFLKKIWTRFARSWPIS